MPRIFKAGDYGKKGNYSADKLKSWVGKEFNITAGHVGDWVNNGYPVTAIPVAGTCKVTDVDDQGYLIGEFAYNSLGESIKDKYPNLSIGIGANGEPNHLAILGYAPPHIKDLDTSFSEFSQDLTGMESSETIDLEEEKKEEIQVRELTTDEMISSLKEQGYTVEKTAEFSQDTLKSIADGLGLMLSAKPVNNLTPQEIFAKAKAEFAREAERDETKKKLVSMFPPVLHKMLEFAINKAYEEAEYSNIIEFSENEKASMATKLKEFSEGESPFKELFKNYTESKEFSETTTAETTDVDKRIGGYYE